MSRQLLEHITPIAWDSQKPGSTGFPRVRWLQQVSDLFDRPVKNRQVVAVPSTAVNLTGATLSSGVGTPNKQQPKRYAEFTVKARITFNVNSTGPVYLYIYRSTIGVPAKGAAPAGGDVIVGGDAFFGGATVSGVNQATSFSYLDTPLGVSTYYWYYIAVSGPNAAVLNLVNTSQLIVMERS